MALLVMLRRRLCIHCIPPHPPPPVEWVAIVQPVGVPILVMCQLGRDINHASLVVKYSRGGLLELYWDPKDQSRGCGMASFNQFLDILHVKRNCLSVREKSCLTVPKIGRACGRRTSSTRAVQI